VSEGPGQQQRYCTNCGAEIRPGNTFCVSCGQWLGPRDGNHISENTASMVVGSTSRGGSLLKSNEVQLVLYFVGPLLFLIVSYLLFRYSVALGVLWIGLVVFVVAMVRRARSSQTRFEQQAFERAAYYRQSTQKAYEEGKHRELAQGAYQQSKKVYEETQTRYLQWSEA
jgi:hypothetical protein